MRDDIDLKYFKSRLEERRETILAGRSMRKEGSRTVELDQSRVGRLSRMDALQQQAMAKATDERADMELLQIQGALGRIKAGEYGYCIKCGEDIAEGRLKVNPGVLTCIECAEKAEK